MQRENRKKSLNSVIVKGIQIKATALCNFKPLIHTSLLNQWFGRFFHIIYVYMQSNFCNMKMNYFQQLKRHANSSLKLGDSVKIWLPFHPAAFAVHLQCAGVHWATRIDIKMLITETGEAMSLRSSLPLLQWSAWPIRIRCLPISQVILPIDSKALPLAPFPYYLVPLFIQDESLGPPLHPGSFPGHSHTTDTSGDPRPVSLQLTVSRDGKWGVPFPFCTFSI